MKDAKAQAKKETAKAAKSTTAPKTTEVVDEETGEIQTVEIVPTTSENVTTFDPSLLDRLDDATDDDANFSLNFKTDLGLKEGEKRNYVYAGTNLMVFNATSEGGEKRRVEAPVLIDSEGNSYSIPNISAVRQLTGGMVAVGTAVRIEFLGEAKLQGGKRVFNYDIRTLNIR